MTDTESPIKTNEEIADAIRKILTSNDIKVGSKKARTIEYSFIQGLVFADNRYAKRPYLIICLLSGRSFLDP